MATTTSVNLDFRIDKSHHFSPLSLLVFAVALLEVIHKLQGNQIFSPNFPTLNPKESVLWLVGRNQLNSNLGLLSWPEMSLATSAIGWGALASW